MNLERFISFAIYSSLLVWMSAFLVVIFRNYKREKPWEIAIIKSFETTVKYIVTISFIYLAMALMGKILEIPGHIISWIFGGS